MRLTINWHSLFEVASLAQSRAYAPYSDFKVGAALLTGSGNIFAGCNVENASYGLTICAERAAVAAGIAAGENEFLALAVVAGSKPVAPCGACRQVLAEFGEQMVIHSRGQDGLEASWNLSDLLPHPFAGAGKP